VRTVGVVVAAGGRWRAPASVADAASYLEIDPRLVAGSLRSYGANREEIDDWIAHVRAFNEREETNWRAPRKQSPVEDAARRALLTRDCPPTPRDLADFRPLFSEALRRGDVT
jgi:hypothetical protein